MPGFQEFVQKLYPKSTIINSEVFSEPRGGPLTGLRLGKTLGQGAMGSVTEIVDVPTDRLFAIRETSFSIDRFILVQNKLSKFRIAPQIFYKAEVERRSRVQYIMIMDIISMPVETFLLNGGSPSELATALKCLLDKKYLLGMLHGDMHLQNVVFLKDGSLGFIDFDFSKFNIAPEINVLDFIPIFGSIKDISRSKKIKPKLLSLFTNQILDYYRDRFNMVIDMNLVQYKKGGGYEYGSSARGILDSYSRSSSFSTKTFQKFFPNFRPPKIVK